VNVTDEPLSPNALALRIAVVEVERHASGSGWDQPARLFALVPTVELAAAEPHLAAELGITDGSQQVLTPVEQELEEDQRSLDDLLGEIMWPESVSRRYPTTLPTRWHSRPSTRTGRTSGSPWVC
jgi:hypothetical protein